MDSHKEMLVTLRAERRAVLLVYFPRGSAHRTTKITSIKKFVPEQTKISSLTYHLHCTEF